MARKETKSAQVLRRSKDQVAVARGNWYEAQQKADTAKAVYDALKSAHNGLEDMLREKPRKSVAPKPLVNLAGKKSSTAKTPKIIFVNDATELAEKTGKSIADAQAALDSNGGDKKAALMSLTS